MENQEIFRCKDLMLAAAIASFDVPLKGLASRGRYFDFLFEDPERAREIEDSWWRGNLEVNAVRYADALKRLKNLLFREKGR